eukprot:scaffold1157_cov122-Cylindrotheca_fusiformis.AAC.15
MAGLSYPMPFDVGRGAELSSDDEQERNTALNPSFRRAPVRSRSDKAARNLPKSKSGRNLPKPGGRSSAKNGKASSKSRNNDLEYASSHSADHGSTRLNQRGTQSRPTLSPGLVTPTKKKKPSSFRKLLSPSPSGRQKIESSYPSHKRNSSMGDIQLPKTDKSRSSRKANRSKGRSLSPMRGTDKPRSLKNFLKSPMKTSRNAQIDDNGVDLGPPLMEEADVQREERNYPRTARTARSKKKSKAENQKPKSFQELLAHSQADPAHGRSSRSHSRDSSSSRESSLSPADVDKPRSAGQLFSGLLESVGHMVENFLEDGDTDDEEEISKFDSRFANWVS